MRSDRYLRCILTIIALELLWLGAKEAAAPALAQQKSDPIAVVITGVRIGNQEYTTLPVAVTGSVQASSIPSHRELPNLQPSSVRVSDPVVIDARQPLGVLIANQPVTVQTGSRPLIVDAIRKAGAAPGH